MIFFVNINFFGVPPEDLSMLNRQYNYKDSFLKAKLSKGMGHNVYGEPAWPNDILYIFPICILSLILLILLLSILNPDPRGIFERANSFHTPVGIIPEWYLYPSFNIIRLIPSKRIGIFLTLIVLVSLFFIPFIESDSLQNPFRRTLSLRYFLFGQFVTLWLSVGAFTDVDNAFFLNPLNL